MSVWTLHPIHQFSTYQSDWDQLNKVGPNHPLFHSDFITPALEQFGHDRIILAIHQNAGYITTMALLEKIHWGIWQTFQPSQLPLGPWISIAEDWSQPVLLQKLADTLPSSVVRIALTQQDPDIQLRPEDRDSIRTLDYIPTARIPITSNFETYWNSRGRNLRRNLQRQRNALKRQNIDFFLEILTDPGKVGSAINDYARLEQDSWKAKQGTAVDSNQAQGLFYRQVLENFCRRRKGIIFRCWYGDQLVASDLVVGQGSMWVILKTAYDASVTQSSPAMLMRQAYLPYLFEQSGAETLEFYGRVMEWHTRLSEDIRTLYHVNYTRWPLRLYLHWRNMK